VIELVAPAPPRLARHRIVVAALLLLALAASPLISAHPAGASTGTGSSHGFRLIDGGHDATVHHRLRPRPQRAGTTRSTTDARTGDGVGSLSDPPVSGLTAAGTVRPRFPSTGRPSSRAPPR
jgi:hypothetical protein